MDISLLFDELKVNFELKRMYYRMNKFAEDSKSISPILITSAADGEGKTIISLILAIIFLEEGKKRCLLIDGNWKNPSLHKWLNVSRSNPAFQIINDPASCVQNSGIRDLDIIAAPRDIDANPEWEKAFAQGTMNGFKNKINSITNNYDVVIVDGQAVFSQNASILDPLFIASIAKYTIMAVMMRRTDRTLLKRAKFALEDVNNSLSIILNNVHNPIYSLRGKK